MEISPRLVLLTALDSRLFTTREILDVSPVMIGVSSATCPTTSTPGFARLRYISTEDLHQGPIRQAMRGIMERAVDLLTGRSPSGPLSGAGQ